MLEKTEELILSYSEMKKNPEKVSRMRRRKRSQHQQLAIQNPNFQTLFALILAALQSSDSHEYSHLVTLCLNQIHRSLSRNPFPTTILSLLPVLIKSKTDEIARKTVELAGAASLMSIEMNEIIALEDGIIVGLISLLGSSRRSVSMAACNAALDLSTTSVGRLRLLEFSALEELVVSFIQVQQCLPAVICLSCNAKGSGSCPRIVFEEEDSSILLLQATLVLINSCTTKQLQKIPRNLSETLVVHLKGLWDKVHSFLVSDTLECSHVGDVYISNIRTNDMAESIFRICMDNSPPGGHSNVKQIKRSIFDWGKINFGQFILDYWEVSPLLFRSKSKDSLQEDNIFSSLAKSFQSNDMPSFLPSMLKNLTSCPPIASDEINVLHFLEEVRDHFGCPIIYEQDIRVVKTHQREGELHYFLQQFGSCSSQAPHVLHVNEILKCKEAYNEGYTVALRGMEFRFKSIAAIADGLASLFGQPSAGVNMYLTPPNSQGLSCHSDDHCVFVCQLIGIKEWKIFPPSRLYVPRLYESIDSWPDSEVENQPMGGCKQFLLKEGDVLYIPRGFPHEAHTTMDENGSAEFSLHLTLAIEVEPPFEWEGFVHVALNHWSEKHREPQQPSSGSISWGLNVMSVNLLHIAIKFIGDIDPAFRRACLVGQMSLSTVSDRPLILNQRMIFQHLMTRINTESKFSDSLEWLEMAVQKHEDLFQQLRWLQYLTRDGEMIESEKSSIFSVDASYILWYCCQNKDIVETAFMDVKCRFCNEVLFEDVEKDYKMLIDKYKEARRQYIGGMLSLHLTGDKICN